MTKSKQKKNSDSANQLTLEKFRINELVQFITNHDNLSIRHHLKDYDAMVCTEIDDTPTLWDIKKLIQDGAQVGIPFTKDNQQIIIYRSLSSHILRKKELLDTTDLTTYSFYHHQLLRGMIDAIDEHYRKFLEELHYYKKDAIAVTNKLSETATLLTQYCISFLNSNCIDKGEPLIPDLLTFHSGTSRMSYDSKLIYKMLGENRDGHKYTYFYSTTTSENFATLLIELLNRKLNDQKLIAGFDAITQIELNKDSHSLPSDTKDRLKWLSEYYKLNAVNRVDGLRYKNSELMFLFRILQDENILLKNIPKEQLALAICILTGISTDTIYNKYPLKPPYNYEKMMDNKTPNSANNAKNKICTAAKNAFMKAGANQI